MSTIRKLDIESVYLNLPVLFQNLLVSLEGWILKRRRYGRSYDKIYTDISKREALQGDDLRGYQRRRLGDFLRVAASSPFWAGRFKNFGVNIESENPFSEIEKLPVLSKETVKENIGGILPKMVSTTGLLRCHTSGTTGSGLIFWETPQAEKERWATWWRYRMWHGINFDTWCGYFGGRTLVPLHQTRSPLWRVNLPGKQLMFSAYHLSPETAKVYVSALQERRIPWLHGYPSILALLANYMLEQRIAPLPSVRIITVGAESLLPQQRNIIERAFNVPVYQHYGLAESVANISECRHGCLHVDEDFSWVEFLPINGEDGVYKIIGTNWTNPAFPLIRYDTGDIARISPGPCSCGCRGRLVLEIDGRREDYVVLPNGAHIGRLDHIFKELIHIREAQIYQREFGSVTIRVVKGSGYDDTREEERLLLEVRKRLGKDIDIKIEYLDHLQRSPSGKLRLVISDIPSMKV